MLQYDAHESHECEHIGRQPSRIQFDNRIPEWMRHIFGQWRVIDTAVLEKKKINFLLKLIFTKFKIAFFFINYFVSI